MKASREMKKFEWKDSKMFGLVFLFAFSLGTTRATERSPVEILGTDLSWPYCCILDCLGASSQLSSQLEEMGLTDFSLNCESTDQGESFFLKLKLDPRQYQDGFKWRSQFFSTREDCVEAYSRLKKSYFQAGFIATACQIEEVSANQFLFRLQYIQPNASRLETRNFWLAEASLTESRKRSLSAGIEAFARSWSQAAENANSFVIDRFETGFGYSPSGEFLISLGLLTSRTEGSGLWSFGLGRHSDRKGCEGWREELDERVSQDWRLDEKGFSEPFSFCHYLERERSWQTEFVISHPSQRTLLKRPAGLSYRADTKKDCEEKELPAYWKSLEAFEDSFEASHALCVPDSNGTWMPSVFSVRK